MGCARGRIYLLVTGLDLYLNEAAWSLSGAQWSVNPPFTGDCIPDMKASASVVIGMLVVISGCPLSISVDRDLQRILMRFVIAVLRLSVLSKSHFSSGE